jgi:hypothetical protein
MKPSNLSNGASAQPLQQRTALNAFRHGVTGQTIVLPAEDVDAYYSYCHEFFCEFNPEGMLERQLVQTIVDCGWRLNRLRANEQTLLSMATVSLEDEAKTPDLRVATAMASALAFARNSKTLANLTLYEQRLSIQLDNARKLLNEAQLGRRAVLNATLARAARRKAEHDELQSQYPQPVPYDPENDGFVFSFSFLDSWIEREARQNRH